MKSLAQIDFLRQRVAAEFFGTFALVFAGTGAIVINEVSGGAITHAGIALTFGLVVLAMSVRPVGCCCTGALESQP